MVISALTLEGSAIRLIPLTREHLDPLSAIGLSQDLWRFTTIRVTSRQEMEAYIATALDGQTAGTTLPFVIVEKGAETVIGTTRFHSLVPEHRRVEIGFTWIVPLRQRTGVNTEAKYLMLRHAFEAWGCIRVEFKADSTNEPSKRAMIGIGATFEGTLRRCRTSEHRIHDLAVFSIIADEWPKVRLDLEQKIRDRSSRR